MRVENVLCVIMTGEFLERFFSSLAYVIWTILRNARDQSVQSEE